MRLNARIVERDGARGASAKPCSRRRRAAPPPAMSDQTMAERSIDGMLFFNQGADPTHWTDGDSSGCRRVDTSSAARRRGGPRISRADRARRAGTRGRSSRTRRSSSRSPTKRRRAAMRRDIAPRSTRAALPAVRRDRGGRAVHGVRARPAASQQRHRTSSSAAAGRSAARQACSSRRSGARWMPLLRYDIGDVVSRAAIGPARADASDGPCSSASKGRVADSLRRTERRSRRRCSTTRSSGAGRPRRPAMAARKATRCTSSIPRRASASAAARGRRAARRARSAGRPERDRCPRRPASTDW